MVDFYGKCIGKYTWNPMGTFQKLKTSKIRGKMESLVRVKLKSTSPVAPPHPVTLPLPHPPRIRQIAPGRTGRTGGVALKGWAVEQ